MSIHQYLQPINAGSQKWQILASNMTRGPHPYNIDGFCMALVVQWLLEIRFSAGAQPEQLGRHLLQDWLGKHGYGGIASSQSIYGETPHGEPIDSAMVRRHSGGALQRVAQYNREETAAGHWNAIQLVIPDGEISNGVIGLYGRHSWLMSWIAGATWAHAVGIYSDGNRRYVFDPNYGVFVFEPAAGNMGNFIGELWQQYDAIGGDCDQVLWTSPPQADDP